MFGRYVIGAHVLCGRVDKIATKRADPASRTFMFASTFGLGFVGENHFTDGIAT